MYRGFQPHMEGLDWPASDVSMKESMADKGVGCCDPD